jgi:probable F420-dependent oxidoreductase
MKINVTLPFDGAAHGDEFVHPDGITQISQVAEKAGFHAALVTDHPCPTGRWLDAGGHHAQDPFVLLSFVAAATTTLRLQTGILVLPYRNPFITARMVSTLDTLSAGRVALGIGTGYLKGEYKALGVDFDTRGDLTDEYIRAMKAAWTQEEFTFKGTGYEALGNRILPLPIQKPHPPILIGGNAKRAIRRAAELGDAWNPFPTASAQLAQTSRTVELNTEVGLPEGIDFLHEYCAEIGRETPPEVVLAGFEHVGKDWNADEVLEKIAKVKAMGVTALAINILGDTRSEWCDYAQRVGEEIVVKI